MFYPEGLVDFALEKSFIPKLPFFLLHRWVQKWLFAKYCPHFSLITLDTYSNNFWFSNISVILEVVANVQNLVYMEKECYFIIPKNVRMQIHLYYCAFYRLSLFSRIEVAAAKLSLPG